jgi:hypothetical protein
MVHNPTEFHLLSILDTDKKIEAKYKRGFGATRISSSHILTKKERKREREEGRNKERKKERKKERRKERKKRNISNLKSGLFVSNVSVESSVNFPKNSCRS